MHDRFKLIFSSLRINLNVIIPIKTRTNIRQLDVIRSRPNIKFAKSLLELARKLLLAPLARALALFILYNQIKKRR